ncbi:MAG: transporter, partial [Cyanobacteria bacterium J06635_11]
MSVLMAVIPAAPAAAQSTITWEDLQAQSTHLRNPYEQLNEDQTFRLSSLYQLREWTKDNPPAPDSIEAKEIQRLEQTFADEGIDPDALLVHVDEAQAYWRSQAQT